MKLEDLPEVTEGSDLHVEVVYKDRVDFPFLRWLKIFRERQGYLTPNMTCSPPLKLSISGKRVPGGGYINPYYIPLKDVRHIRRVDES